ncbi:MAG: hypothetical protein M9947_04440 [Thermomicrobiales bacterium]|nr:hypothetical protein [Thermomicrobiales bacterium]
MAREVFISEEKINTYLQGAPLISADGSTAIFAINRKDGPNGELVGHVYRMLLSSGVPQEVGVVGSSPQLDVSRDGQTILIRTLPNTGNKLYVADLAQNNLVLEEDGGTELTDAVLNQEGRVIYFTIRRDTKIVGVDEPVRAGLWAIDAAGGNLRPVVLLDDIRDLVGADEGDQLTVPEILTMGISAVADRAVFAIRNDTKGEWYVISSLGDGGETQLLHGPSEFVWRVTMSGSGSTVFIADVVLGDESRTPRFTIVGPAGGSPRELPPMIAGGTGVGSRGLMLSYDGSILLGGGTGLMMYTADGVVRSMLSNCAQLTNVPSYLEAATMSSTGHHVLFLGAYPGGSRLVVIEVQTDGALTAPNDNQVTVEPAAIEAGAADTLTITVEERATPARVCATLRRGTDVLAGPLDLNDEGRNGDEVAGDGVYTRDEVVLPASIDPGDLTVRVAIEVDDPDGYRTTTMFDLTERLTVTERRALANPGIAGMA